MKLVLYEHITSGALSEHPMPESLAAEGEAMLQAIARDLLAVKDISLVILRDARLSNVMTSSSVKTLSSATQQQFNQHWQSLLTEEDFFILVAPESEGVLAQRCQQVQHAGKHSLGCSEASIRLWSDKYLSAEKLLLQGIGTIPTEIASRWLSQPTDLPADGWIVKPRFGAGCLDTFKLPSTKAAREHLQAMLPEQLEQTIVQPFINGIACSMTLLCDTQTVTVLSINRQHISYQGARLQAVDVAICQQAIEEFTIKKATLLARQIHAAFKGLWGIVGVDLVVQADEITVVEINPRFTTAYCELTAKTSVNAVALMLQNAYRLVDKE